MQETGDGAEWSRALAGVGRAFGLLFQRHHRRVFRHAVRLVVLQADADEVMAGAFFELWRRRADVRLVDGSVLPWLLATTTFLSRNRLRGMLRYQAVLARLPRPDSPDAADEAMDRLQQREHRRRIARALRQVSARDAALITLTMLDGYSPTEAAAAVGITPATARSRLFRARGRLRLLLSEEQQAGIDLIEGPTP